MSSLRDQVALVTGSSRGIGAAIAKSLAQQGAKVVVHGRDSAALSSIRKEIELAGGRSMQVSGDVTNFSDVEAARLRIEGEFGPVDILVANAGGSFTPPGPLEDTSQEGWHARNTESTGRGCSPWRSAGFPKGLCSILSPMLALPPLIRDKNRMR
jgi:3-oxoacyl-[acyl-carrier protein] reductase